jgi:hypothetical protein
MLGTILINHLILLLIGALPTWLSSGWALSGLRRAPSQGCNFGSRKLPVQCQTRKSPSGGRA